MIFGIDVAKWQGDINHDLVVRSGIQFVICRAKGSEGGRDETFLHNYYEFANAGARVGAYGFIRVDQDPTEWAEDFCDYVLPHWSEFNIRPMIDCEAPHSRQPWRKDHDLMPVEERIEWLHKAIGIVEHEFRCPVIIYTNWSYWSKGMGGIIDYTDRMNCVARYSQIPGLVDFNANRPWSSWVLHQYSSIGRVEGIDANVDLQVLNDGYTLDDLTGETVSEYTIINDPPARRQYYNPRRDGNKASGTIVLHSAENWADVKPPDTGAEAVARFISDRTTIGSYHRLADSDGVVKVMPFTYEAFHDGTGTNRWSIGISGAFRVEQWATLSADWKKKVVDWMAFAACEAALHVYNESNIVVPAKFISVADARAKKPGFITHGELDPGRRSDPGPQFPRQQFLDAYTYFMALNGIQVGNTPAPPPPPVTPPKPQPPTEETVVVTMKLPVLREGDKGNDVRDLQELLNAHCGQKLSPDGVFNTRTTTGVKNVQRFFGLTPDGIVGEKTWGAISLAAFPVKL